jgi:hypothetical protein
MAEHPRGLGPVAVAAGKCLDHERSFDLLNGRADQESNEFIRGKRLRGVLGRSEVVSRHEPFPINARSDRRSGSRRNSSPVA